MFKHKTIILQCLITALVFSFSTALDETRAAEPKSGWGADVGVSSGYLVAKKKKHHGPPSHAPAHGYRAKYQYRYYPSSNIYFDVDRKLYFFLQGGNWEFAASLPFNLIPKLGSHVSIEMEIERPYLFNKEHRTKYSPGQVKKQKKHKWKNK
jgi:hypothetical protein